MCALYAGVDLTGLADGLLLPVPLMAALVLARALEIAPGRHGRAIALVLGVGALAGAWLAWRLRVGTGDYSPDSLAIALAMVGAVTLALIPQRARVLVLRPLGLDPDSPVHAVAAVGVIVTVAAAMVLFRELQREAPTAPIPSYVSDEVAALLSDAGLAFAGVGFLITRGLRASLARLDVRPIRARVVLLALAAAVAFHLVVGLMEHAESVWLPDISKLEDRFRYEFVGLPPWLGAVLVSVAAGLGEELVFRGALQPRLGIVPTALVFATFHVQYQLPGMAMIFVVGLALGVLKQRTSTTFTACVHVFYDIGAFVFSD
ncbi:MAG: CPBP family intramembrane metalloprotease [Candidatus Rokubacteria bacterium]|nr:CPBP family intramembrane metalloprotease [Candidatus Rokubacteria bacterium]